MIAILMLFSLVADSSGCFLCHSEVRAKFKSSIHYSEGLLCSDCHGGKDSEIDLKKAHSGNFTRLKNKKEIVDVCSKCHSSAEKMAPYGISFNQKELYMTSAHGKLLGKNKNVPVCSNCHNYHEVYKSKDSRSPVSKTKIPFKCGECHERELNEYRESIHFEFVREGKDGSPTCIDCHGSHGAYPPGYKDIDKVCGKCHQEIRNEFLKSPHYKAFIETGLKECEACHENHKVLKAGERLWEEKCITCHKEGEKALKIKDEILSILKETENSYKFASEFVSKIKKIPLDVQDLENRLNEAKNEFEKELAILHNLNIEEIKTKIGQIKGVYDDVAHEAINKYKLFQTRYFLIPGVWLLVIVTVFLIFEYKRIKEKE